MSREPGDRRRRVLFVAEALTLSQVVRLVALARCLDPARYDVKFACGPFDGVAFRGTGIEPIPLFTVERERALRQVERGERIYEKEVLARYVEEELRLFDRLQPDLVVGDFRLSLPISAARAGVRCFSLINAYFSPYAERDAFPMPEHPIVSLLGSKRAAQYFPRALPAVFAHFVAPIDAVRKRYGLQPTGGLLHALCAGDMALFPDVPELCPVRALPAEHFFLGPVAWTPPLPEPDFLADLGERPLVYITLGSSGRVAALDSVLQVVGEHQVLGVIATADRVSPARLPPNVRVASYVPGDSLARRASFLVTNGGASTSYQALAEGKPVLGIPTNLDQYLAMTNIERAGAGRLVRAGEATPAAVRAAFAELSSSTALRRGAADMAAAFSRLSSTERFRWLVQRTLDAGAPAAQLRPVASSFHPDDRSIPS